MNFSMSDLYLYIFSICGSFATFLFSSGKDFETIARNLKRIKPEWINEYWINLFVFFLIIFFIPFVADVIENPINLKEAMLVGFSGSTIIKSSIRSGITRLKKRDSRHG
jgi:hypothetical protein